MGLFDKKETENVTAMPEVAECDARIAGLMQQRQDVIFRIGTKYVESNTLISSKGTPYEADMSELETIAQDIAVTEKRKLAVQGLRRCEKCGNVLVIDSAFCNKCGAQLEAMQVEVMQNICPKCGALYDAGAMFCISCGNKL